MTLETRTIKLQNKYATSVIKSKLPVKVFLSPGFQIGCDLASKLDLLNDQVIEGVKNISDEWVKRAGKTVVSQRILLEQILERIAKKNPDDISHKEFEEIVETMSTLKSIYDELRSLEGAYRNPSLSKPLVGMVVTDLRRHEYLLHHYGKDGKSFFVEPYSRQEIKAVLITAIKGDIIIASRLGNKENGALPNLTYGGKRYKKDSGKWMHGMYKENVPILCSNSSKECPELNTLAVYQAIINSSRKGRQTAHLLDQVQNPLLDPTYDVHPNVISYNAIQLRNHQPI